MTPPEPSDPLIRLVGVERTYRSTTIPVAALRGVDLEVERGTLTVVHGRSGSGKTTLLNIVGGLDRADTGMIEVAGTDLSAATDEDLVEFRRSTVSFIFQGFGLLPMLSAAENVEVPLRLRDDHRSGRRELSARRDRVDSMLRLVGLGARAAHRPSQLSGGEQQRVAIARALVVEPALLIADEPTGQLDSRTGGEILDLLASIVVDREVTAVVATHDAALIGRADRRVELSDGRIAAV